MPKPYDYRWQKFRTAYLREHPLCAMCEAIGHVTPATVVDHIQPHKGDFKLFWDTSNMQALCKRCHDGAKQELDNTGRLRGADVNGMPLDPKHPWARDS